ncbi:MAG: hypothetical protein ABI321_08265, partial [Polyangia bacterium]
MSGEAWFGRQVGSLALSHARSESPMAMVRAAAWANTMGRLGVHLPLFVVHDIGLLLTAGSRGGFELATPEAMLQAISAGPELRAACQDYLALLTMLAESEVAERASALRLRD